MPGDEDNETPTPGRGATRIKGTSQRLTEHSKSLNFEEEDADNVEENC